MLPPREERRLQRAKNRLDRLRVKRARIDFDISMAENQVTHLEILAMVNRLSIRKD